MIVIEEKKCTGCGLCVRICHESCMILYDEQLRIDTNLCSTCGQCIAVCPTQALNWNNHSPQPFEKNRLPDSDQLDELLKQRRTIRHFKKEKPGKKILEEIITYGAYAPTHSHDFRVIVIDDDRLLERLDKVVYHYNKKIHRYLFKPRFIQFLLRFLPPSHKIEYLKARPKLEKSLKIGRAYDSIPPVIICIVGDRRIPLSTESAQYMLYNMDLYARTKGLGCRNLVGNQMFLNRDRKFRDSIHLDKREKFFAIMGIGYPSINFRNKVTGRDLDTQWNDKSNSVGS